MNKINNSNNLLASIAVFAEMCNTEKDIQGILAEFIKYIFAFERIWSLDSVEMTDLLKKHFDFDLPEAVVRTCMNTLTKDGFTIKRSGKFSVIDTSYNVEKISDKLDLKKTKQEEIVNDLFVYYETILQKHATEDERKSLEEGFISYLMENGISEKYSTIISSFILEKSKEEHFVSELNQIKEGLVLITGLRYTTDLNHVGYWHDELTIYLDTEHLFNAEGFNGDVFQKLFNDFFALISEINATFLKRYHKKVIHLKYFADTKDEVDRFFYVAQRIIKREDNSSPENIAMESICKGCTTISEILKKKTTFETNLKTKGITLQEELDYYSKPKYNIEDAQLFEKYKERYSDDEIAEILRSFTKINFLRRGRNRTSFEKCGHIILTGKISSLVMSKDLVIKNEAKDIPFVTDIYFITNRIWYRLNKGLSKSEKLPSTLDVVTKAQIVLSSQINRSVDKQYEKLKSDLKNGEITNDSAQSWYYNLREKARKPEEINQENIQESVEFIFENDLDRYLREKSSLKQKVQEGEEAIKKLNRIESQRIRSRKRIYKLITRVAFYLISILSIIFLISLPFGVWYLAKSIEVNQDTPLSVWSFAITLAIELLGIFKFVKPFYKWLKKKSHSKYLKCVRNIK